MSSPPVDEHKSATLLVVDDDPRSLAILEPVLLSKGYRVRIANSGEAALESVEMTPPDLVLLDIDMPGMDGYEVCSQLKNRPETRMIPVVMVTGLSALEDKLRAIEMGADDFLNKPFNSIELLTRIRALLRAKFLNDQLESAEDVLFTLARTIQAKDAYTEGHVERVAGYALVLGDRLSLSEGDREALRKGGILHDIGKLRVPDEILTKPTRLTVDEREVIRNHPQWGEEICRKLRSIRPALPVVRHHHERLDGSGYPDGLKGNAIPITARILAIVDVFDALTTTRPYRRALTRDQALEVLWDECGKGWWDRDILSAFADLIVERSVT
ncbi:MAG: response regulator [Elusimicrobia bacterium]|nr:response regulator [Elusimicrobiota bacterium]